MIRKTAVAAALFGLSAAASAQTTVQALNGAADVDLQGSFAYALTWNPGAAGTQVGDATFSYAGSTAGVAYSAQNYIGSWHSGSGAAAAGLGSVMQSIIWSWTAGGPEVMSLSLSGLTVGQTYKTQLLFGEDCCSRGFDVYQDNALIADNVSPFGLSGNNYKGAAVLSHTFTATSTSVNFGFGGVAPYGDNNPILNAATLEVAAVPEPSTYAMLIAGLGMLGFVARRRKHA